MADLKLAEAGIWAPNLHSRMIAEVFKVMFLCGLAVAAGCKTESRRAAGAGNQAGHSHNLADIDCPLRRAGVDPSGLRSFAEVQRYIAFLDCPERAAWQKPDEVVTVLALQGNETVFDLEAGSGYISFKLAQAVPPGKVVAADLEPEMIRHIHHKAIVERVTNLTPVIIKADDPQVPGEADLVFVCDVLRHAGAGPIRIDPEHLESQAAERLQVGKHVLLVGVVQFVKGRAEVGDGWPLELAVNPRQDVREHRVSKKIVGPTRVAPLPAELQDARSAQALAGVKHGVQGLHPDLGMHPIAAEPHRCAPLAGPPDGRDDAAALPVRREPGRDVGRSAVGGGERDPLSLGHGLVEGHPVVRLARGAVQPM
jgi:SAM-dependent methyltransferase